LPHEDHCLVEMCVFPQRRRNEHPAGSVHVDVDGEADQPPLQFANAGVEVRKAFELLLDQLPVRERVDEEAVVRVRGDHQMSRATLEKSVAVPRRDRQAPLNIQI
jgi:hypothetical protein